MLTRIDHRPSAPTAIEWLKWSDAGLQATVAVSWLLLVLRYQYGVEWLDGHDGAIDLLFVAAILGILVIRLLSRSRSPRRTAFRIAMTLASTVVALAAAEGLARLQYREARSSRNAGDYIAQRGAGPEVRVNALGFREREIPARSDRYRVAIVGDSFTWGNGLEERERYSNRLGEFLGPRYEVFNFGVPGNNMPQHLDVLKSALSTAPDFVLLQLYINDFETGSMARPSAFPLLPGFFDRTLERSSLLYDLARDQWTHLQEFAGVSESYVHYMDRNLRDPGLPNAREAYGNLREFFTRAHAAGVPAGAVLFPAIDALGPYGRSYPFGYLHEGVRHVCADEGVRCLDLLPTFSGFADPRALWVSPFDAHPDALASRRAAYAIVGAFGDAWSR